MYLVTDRANWALDQTALEQSVMTGWGIIGAKKALITNRSRLHFLSPDLFLNHYRLRGLTVGTRNSFDFFHGIPDDAPKYAPRLDKISAAQKWLSAIRVTNRATANALKKFGISVPIHIIPIAVDMRRHAVASSAEKKMIRNSLGIATDVTIIGSFQKDGQGWGNGLEPKLEKGPDIFVETISILRHQGLKPLVLLTGPARGYVIELLERESIPFKYLGVLDKEKVSQLYSALDLYLVASRYEGGPRALLESLASGVPVATTPVGQAVEVLCESNYSTISKDISPQALSEQVLKLLRKFDGSVDPINAREWASKFSLENIGPKWGNI